MEIGAGRLLWECLVALAVIVPTLIVGAISVLVLYLVYQHRRFANIPSPPRKDFFTGHARLVMETINKGSSFSDFVVEQMRIYGSIFHLFMFTKPSIICLDPSCTKQILHSTTHFKPPAEVQFFWNVYGQRYLHHGLLTESNVTKHMKRRALFDPAFHRKYLKNLISSFNKSANVLIDKLAKVADGKTEVLMLDEFNKFTLDVLAKVAFGLDLLEDKGFNKAICKSLVGVEICFYKPWIQWSPLASDRKFRQECRESVRLIRETGRQCVQDRIDAKKRGEPIPNDILTYILQQSDDLQGDEDFNMENMLDEFCTFFIAGQETTANLMAFMLVELGHHPDVMHRLQTEAKAVLGDSDYVKFEDLGKLEYMMLVIKETLRLWPPVIGTSRQLAHEETLLGYKIPAGTPVWLNTYTMGRNEKYFPDHLDFNPDRFIDTGEDRHLFTHFPFSMGIRSCIGQQFALIEARLIMSRLLQTFNFRLVPGQPRGDVLQEILIKPKGRCKNYITLAE
ncbi:cholesterol 24-hydroxylase-like [Patiria miniata]|uniref:Cholesterol 24-hydroxylase n=1 Tax=Patiria miniata TaxID=46514 RepID=A0A914BDT7_PATMI|nr:cholesterol 24-hydroxylase-like [Patiria miniata]